MSVWINERLILAPGMLKVTQANLQIHREKLPAYYFMIFRIFVHVLSTDRTDCKYRTSKFFSFDLMIIITKIELFSRAQ